MYIIAHETILKIQHLFPAHIFLSAKHSCRGSGEPSTRRACRLLLSQKCPLQSQHPKELGCAAHVWHLHTAQGTQGCTHQCNPQAPDIWAHVVALPGRAGIYPFRLKREEGPVKLCAMQGATRSICKPRKNSEPGTAPEANLWPGQPSNPSRETSQGIT